MRTIQWIGTVLALIFCAAWAIAADIPLVADGQPQADVVLPKDASETLKNTAAEIVTHVEKMSGAKLPTVDGERPLNRIILQVDPKMIPQEDAFRILAKGNEIRLIGGGEMGAQFAAYAFLEDLGVRWLIPGEGGDLVPSKKTIAYPETDRTETPKFIHRCFYVRSDDAVQWAVRNRLNGFYKKEFAEAHGNLIYLPPFVGSIHSFVHILPPEKYFDEHPEYYALINGKRIKADMRGGQICTSNPDVIRIIAESIRAYFKENPGARVFSIAPNDGYGWCECEACQAIDEKMCKSKKWYRRESERVVSDRLCVFANEIARQSVHDMPSKELYMFSYVSYCEPPETCRPDAHVTHVVCHYIPACYAHPINTPGCPENEIYNNDLKGWIKISPQMMVYAYTDKGQWVDLPRPVVRQMAADIKYYYDLGIRKYLAQSGAGNWDQNGPLYYVTAKLTWDPSADVESIIREWNEGMYGSAAEEMMAWYNAVEKVIADSRGHYGGSPFSEATAVYKPGCFQEAMTHLDKALALAENDVVRGRIAKVKEKFAFGMAGADAICWREKWDETGDRTALAKAHEAAQKILSTKKGFGGISMKQFGEFLQGIMAESADGLTWTGWGKPETKGGKECRNSDETGLGDNAAGWAAFSTVLDDLAKTHVVTMEVWGESDFSGLVICSRGKGKGASSGGEWKPLPREGEVSKKPEWCTIRFTVPPDMLDSATKRQRFGFGGGDSQVWVSTIQIEKKD
ncbi:MAG: DUF4838 domain-containing protein [Planctomycetota bacterium]